MSKQQYHSGFKSGTYVGDAAATLAITGIGFRPNLVIIWPQIPGAGGYYIAFKCTDDALLTFIEKTGNREYVVDMIISLDADGFTVGDGTGSANYMNVAARNYAYQAFAE